MTCISRRSLLSLGATVLLSGAVALPACVDQHPERKGASAGAANGGQGETAADASAGAAARTYRIVATTPAIMQICDRLALDLAGVPKTTSAVPVRYAGLPEIGTPMAPDLEKLMTVHPDFVLSPTSLQEDLQPKYEAAGLQALFLNLRSVDGLYGSADLLGMLFDREDEADAMRAGYDDFLAGFEESVAGKDAPSVLVLMGVPGSYLVATENSYVGSLVAQAGGKNVYAGSSEEFLNVNTEDMQQRDADVILRAAHGVPDDVVEMFAEEFATNDIWRHFRAVKEGRVYDLSYDYFGMSATFDYPKAFADLREYLYGDAPDASGASTGSSSVGANRLASIPRSSASSASSAQPRSMHAMLKQSCFVEQPAGLFESCGTAHGTHAPGLGCISANSNAATAVA